MRRPSTALLVLLALLAGTAAAAQPPGASEAQPSPRPKDPTAVTRSGSRDLTPAPDVRAMSPMPHEQARAPQHLRAIGLLGLFHFVATLILAGIGLRRLKAIERRLDRLR